MTQHTTPPSDRHDIANILLKVALNTIYLNRRHKYINLCHVKCCVLFSECTSGILSFSITMLSLKYMSCFAICLAYINLRLLLFAYGHQSIHIDYNA
jgi:hypothetical protein